MNSKGLTTTAAARLLLQFGPNVYHPVKTKSDVAEFFNNFTDPLVIILLVIALISFFMGEPVNGLIIGFMVGLSVTLNFYQEHRANQAAQKLLNQVALTATVIRDGQTATIPSDRLVPGDWVSLNAGDMVTADMRLVESLHCYVNQSALTGESLPVAKDLTHDQSLLAGTSLTSGSATAVVEATGSNTQFSHLVASLAKADDANDFTLGIRAFSRTLVKLILILVALIFLVSALFKHDLFTSFSFAIAVAVGLTPEFLPMIMSVTMTKGAALLAHKGIIVKKLVAIPAFGSMDLLCTDKTGTLTEDKIKLVKYIDLNNRPSDIVLKHAYINSALETGIENPLDQAIKAYRHLDIKAYQKLDELPFDFDRRQLSLLVKNQGQPILITKGAPESLQRSCTRLLDNGKEVKLTPAHRKQINALYRQLSQDGYRVLAVSAKTMPAGTKRIRYPDLQASTFLGFTAFLDPVKARIKSALNSLEAIGVGLKVISGDNELVCKKICSEAGIPFTGILLGSQAEQLSDAKLAPILEQVSICARFSPAQKERAIRLLRSRGHVVGYLGDGINDAPSLKAADVGISVANAVDVARESADLIMTHKNLADLHEGIIQGRGIFQNTLKYLQMGLSSNFGNMFSMLGAVIFLPFLPMLPLQILLNNFLYDFAQISLPTDRVDPDSLLSPTRWHLPSIKRFMLTLGPVSTLFDFFSFGLLAIFYRTNPAAFQTGWFMESLATQVLVIHVIRTRKIPFLQSWPSPALLLSTLVIVLVGWLLPYLPVGRAFSFIPLPLPILGMLLTVVAAYLILAQITKSLLYRFTPTQT